MLKRNRKWLALYSLLVVAALVLSACGSGGGGQSTDNQQPQQQEPSQASGPDSPNYLKLNLGDEPPSLDPQLATDTISFEIIGATYEGLVRQDANGDFPQGSGIAESWEVSEDGLTYTFHLRDAQWSDGKPVTANDFAFAWKRAMDPRTASQYSYIVYPYIKGGDAVAGACGDDGSCEGDDAKIEEALNNVGIEVVDEKTLKVTLSQNVPFFMNLLTFPVWRPVRQDIVEQYGDQFATDADKAVYNGPFIVKEWNHNNSLRLEKNPTYWDAQSVKLDYIDFVMVSDAAAYINAYEAGEIDITGVPAEFKEQFEQTHADELGRYADGATFYLVLNTTKKPWNNPKARRAVALAIDRDIYINTLNKGIGLPAVSYTNPVITSPGEPGVSFEEKYVRPLNLFPTKAQPEEAKRLWQEALQEEGISELPTLEFVGDNGDVVKTRLEFFQQQLKQNLGIDMQIVQVPFEERLERQRTQKFDVIMAGWGPDYDHPLTFLDMWVCDGPYNDGKYCSEQYDNLVKQLQQATDPAQQRELAIELEKLIGQDVPIVPIYHREVLYAQKPYVKNLIRRAVGFSPEFKWAYTEGRGK
ncbi:peptide ABC transporter substrate-binding protein [Thermaerobacter sp. PB12/4term]|uniref:peptide ABC transporter substrate-binding protein n=1 Tax=Thermaerobacter sp. PB12/4term TaxID=2293838 RepID=UPI000E32BFB3|nr:peptide ABC transporter substrate-binding protein [Thermaerobacter sp. PB12/4term]QIA26341.1 peptide ABC transporter substrate-binding protein [Thermaerobacter sp. PB12/4term]